MMPRFVKGRQNRYLAKNIVVVVVVVVARRTVKGCFVWTYRECLSHLFAARIGFNSYKRLPLLMAASILSLSLVKWLAIVVTGIVVERRNERRGIGTIANFYSPSSCSRRLLLYTSHPSLSVCLSFFFAHYLSVASLYQTGWRPSNIHTHTHTHTQTHTAETDTYTSEFYFPSLLCARNPFIAFSAFVQRVWNCAIGNIIQPPLKVHQTFETCVCLRAFRFRVLLYGQERERASSILPTQAHRTLTNPPATLFDGQAMEFSSFNKAVACTSRSDKNDRTWHVEIYPASNTRLTRSVQSGSNHRRMFDQASGGPAVLVSISDRLVRAGFLDREDQVIEPRERVAWSFSDIKM